MFPELERALCETDSIVYLCSGNVVRSAFAEIYTRHLGCPRPVRSAATVYRNPRIFSVTVEALLARGVAPEAIRSFRPEHLEDLRPRLSERPLFLAMRRMHIEALGAADREHAWLLGEVLSPGEEIADPVEEGAEFEWTFARIARSVEALVLYLSVEGR